MLWLCGMVSLPGFVLAWAAHGLEPLATVVTWVATAPVAVTCLMAVYFAVFRPDKLQSEDYQIRHETLELIREKGTANEVVESSLGVLPNPAHQQGGSKEAE